MTDLIPWLLTAEIVGLAAFPLVFRAFPGLADRGFGISIPAGMLLVSTVVWLLSYVNVLPNDQWAWWLVVLLVALGGGIAVRKHLVDLKQLIVRRWSVLVASQVVFLAFFLLFALLRSHDPNITNTEKPMEILMLNAAVSAESAPPEDPWLAGETVAYYYGGYWNLGGIATLSAVPSANGFNLSLALIGGMAAAAMFSLVYSMVARDGGGPRVTALSGLIAVSLMLVVASLAGWWELAATYGIGSSGFYEWLAIDGLRPNAEPDNWRPDQFWWWFRASRVINSFDENGVGLDFTIQEFPAFSFVLGDLHPHVISIPFVIVGLVAAFNLFVSSDRWDLKWLNRNPYSTVAIGLIIATSGFINQADILLMSGLFGGVVVLKTYGESGRSLLFSVLNAWLPLAAVAFAGILVFSPFYFGTLGGQLQSPPIAPAEFGSRPVHFLTVWGLFLLVLAPFAVHYAGPMASRYAGAMWRARGGASPSTFFESFTSKGLRERFAELRYAEDDKVAGATLASQAKTDPNSATKQAHAEETREDRELLSRLDLSSVVIPFLMVTGPYLIWAITHLAFNDRATFSHVFTRLGTVLPLSVIFIALAFVALKKAHQGGRPSSLFVLLVAALGVYLLLGAELFFVHDLFGNRMNTVFKFYFQVWILFSAAAGYGMFYWLRTHSVLRGRGMILSRTAAVAVAVLLVGPLWYPIAAGYSKAEDYSGPVTLDGWAFLDRFNEADATAINWLNDEGVPGSRIVEAVGGSYTEHGRISAATGMPTLLGWPGHERQWRGSDELFFTREGDIRNIYESEDEVLTEELLQRYEVTYVVVGPRERAAYPSLDVSKFDSLGEKVLESNGVSIYQVRGQIS